MVKNRVVINELSLVVGFVFVVSGSVVVGVVVMLILGLRRIWQIREAEKEFKEFKIEQRVSGCDVCYDMLATLECTVCKKQICTVCAPESTCERQIKHKLVLIKMNDNANDG